MKETIYKRIIELSNMFINCFNTDNISYLASLTHSNITWIDITSGKILCGKTQVINWITSHSNNPANIITDCSCKLMSHSGNIYIVAGDYIQNSVFCCHVSFVWIVDSSHCSLFHAHFSNSIPALFNSHLLFRGKSAETFVLMPDDILYIEAANIYCHIHCNSKTYYAYQSLSEITDVLPDEFMRIHRSYIVNRNYIKRIQRFFVELINGISLPIPEKKYMKVLSEAEQYLAVGSDKI